MQKRVLGRSAALAAILGIASGAQAIFVIDLNTLINGDMPPGTNPRATATFEDQGGGNIKLTMTNNMASSIFISTWLFNIDPWVSGITVNYLSGNEATNFAGAAQDQYFGDANGQSSVKGGYFDLLFDWIPPHNGNKFYGGQSSVYLISGSGLTEQSFNAVSVPGGGSEGPGGYMSAAKVQGFGSSGSIGDGGGTPQSVPEPFTMALMGTAAVAGYRRLRRRANG